MYSISKLTFFDRQIRFYPETYSTNDIAKEISSEEKTASPFAVFTDFQTKGRGQRGKYWESDRGENILLSVSIPIHLPVECIQTLTPLFSLEIQKLIVNILLQNRISEPVFIKWPNDIILHNKKIMGILVESTILGAHLSNLIIGIGMNIYQTKFSDDNPRAASLEGLFPHVSWNRTAITSSLLQVIETFCIHSIPHVSSNLSHHQRDKYNKNLYKLGQTIRIPPNHSYLNLGIETNGNICLQDIHTNEILRLNSSSGLDWDY